jgi:hypothetical protein
MQDLHISREKRERKESSVAVSQNIFTALFKRQK